jgi:hypothetical protein
VPVALSGPTPPITPLALIASTPSGATVAGRPVMVPDTVPVVAWATTAMSSEPTTASRVPIRRTAK